MRVVIVPGIEARSSFPADVSSASRARSFVRDTLEEWDAEPCIDAATLAVSELVTNAVLHARSAPDVVLRLDSGRLRIEVHDDSPLPPSRKRYGLEAGTGRGLLLVESLSASWGSDRTEHGKSVWLELDVRAAVESVDIVLDAETIADLAELAGVDDLSELDRRSGPRPGSREPGRGPASLWVAR